MNVYLPIRLADEKKVVLAKNGILSVDPYTAKVEIYPYPSSLPVPIDQLVIVEERDIQEELTENGKERKFQISIRKTMFYKWDGKKLNEITNLKQ